MVVMPLAAAAALAEAKVSRWLAPGSPANARMSIRPGATIVAAAVDDVGAFGHAGRANAAPGIANDAVGDQHVAALVEIARRIDDPGVGEQDGAAVGQHDWLPRSACGVRLSCPLPLRERAAQALQRLMTGEGAAAVPLTQPIAC